jgi:hypothetical protein
VSSFKGLLPKSILCFHKLMLRQAQQNGKVI